MRRRRRSRPREGQGAAARTRDRLLTLLLVLLAVAVGAFASSFAQRWLTASAGEVAARRDTGAGHVGDRSASGGVWSAADPVDSEADELERSRIRVEVLNAAGVAGIADRMTGLLRDHGFDVVNYGNAKAEGLKSSVVIDRAGNIEYAREVARAMGDAPVRRELLPGDFVDVTVLLGRDHARLLNTTRAALHKKN